MNHGLSSHYIYIYISHPWAGTPVPKQPVFHGMFLFGVAKPIQQCLLDLIKPLALLTLSNPNLERENLLCSEWRRSSSEPLRSWAFSSIPTVSSVPRIGRSSRGTSTSDVWRMTFGRREKRDLPWFQDIPSWRILRTYGKLSNMWISLPPWKLSGLPCWGWGVDELNP